MSEGGDKQNSENTKGDVRLGPNGDASLPATTAPLALSHSTEGATRQLQSWEESSAQPTNLPLTLLSPFFPLQPLHLSSQLKTLPRSCMLTAPSSPGLRSNVTFLSAAFPDHASHFHPLPASFFSFVLITGQHTPYIAYLPSLWSVCLH